jgi:hypothetical protein
MDYLGRLHRSAGTPAMLVSLADKTHNAEAIAADLTDADGAPGLAVFDRFSARASAVAWLYLKLAAAFAADPSLPKRLTNRLRAAAIVIHDHAARVAVEIGGAKEVAAGHAQWVGTWGVMPVEPLEEMEAAVARFRLARTVGDIVDHPTLPHDGFADLLTWAAARFEFPESTSKPHEKRLQKQFTSDGYTLRHDIPLWDGWDHPIAEEPDFPALPDVPWEGASGVGYHQWAPASLQALVVDNAVGDTMGEAVRDGLDATYDHVVRLLADEGWAVVDGGGRYADVAFGIDRPYGGGWRRL